LYIGGFKVQGVGVQDFGAELVADEEKTIRERGPPGSKK
jgi:hypothetical protein